MEISKFTFKLSQRVRIACSGEAGEVIARAEYSDGSEPRYLVRYSNGTGVATEQWWGESALVPA